MQMRKHVELVKDGEERELVEDGRRLLFQTSSGRAIQGYHIHAPHVKNAEKSDEEDMTVGSTAKENGEVCGCVGCEYRCAHGGEVPRAEHTHTCPNHLTLRRCESRLQLTLNLCMYPVQRKNRSKGALGFGSSVHKEWEEGELERGKGKMAWWRRETKAGQKATRGESIVW